MNIVPATKHHARELARIMRKEDREEILASGGFLPEQALRASINRSVEAWAAYEKGHLLAVFGVSVHTGGWASPWLLSSVHVEKHPLAFWRESKIWADKWRTKYPRLVQMMHAKYVRALHWIERLGFRVEAPQPFGVSGSLFCRVSLTTEKIVCVSQ